jgi:hypothetical protein
MLTLATFPAEKNASPLVYELAHAGLIEAWVSPAIPKSARTSSATIQNSPPKSSRASQCAIRLTERSVIRHEPDNQFLECALAADAEFIVTVNAASGHFYRKQYQAVTVARPGEFLTVPDVG